MKIVTLAEIQDAVNRTNIETLVANQESGFVSYSQGRSVVPPVGHLEFLNPPGECHIKYGYTTNDDIFAIKVATGFYHNLMAGLPSGDGLVLVFNTKTGLLKTILLDEGYLTNIRTALAGLICANYLAPPEVYGIGIFGTGCQAKLQLEYLKIGLKNLECQNVWVWGRSMDKLEIYRQEIAPMNLNVHLSTNASDVVENCNLIITTTASKQPLFNANLIQPGTHITAIGADSPGKQELDSEMFKRADICVADSMSQCSKYGDMSYAIKENLIDKSKVTELGNVISDPTLRRNNDQQITVADLTGIAVQDMQIAALINEIVEEKALAKLTV